MRFATALLLLVVAQDQAQRPPRFRAGVEVVELDVSVLDRTRRPVRGLSAADFTVLEDGVPQEIVAFEEVNVPGPEPAPAGWLREVAADVRSNDLSASRLLVLVLDDATLPRDPRVVKTAKTIARKVIDGLGPQDLAAVLFTMNNANSQDFTMEHARLARAVDALRFGFISPRPGFTGAGIPPPSRATLENGLWFHYSIATVRRAAEYLRDAPQRRKTLIYISVGVPVDFTPGGTEAGAASAESDLQRDLAGETQRAFAQAVRSNVTIYGMDPSGLEVDDTRLSRQFLQSISENTGGYAVVNTNEPESEVAAVLGESGSYYLLGFQSTNQKADGKFRRLRVRVDRPGVTVRSRAGYYGARNTRAASSETAAGTNSPLTDAIGGLLPKGDLPMQVTVAPFAGTGKRESALAIVTQLAQPPVSEPRRQKIEILTAAFDIDGRPKGSIRQTVELGLRPANGASHYEVLLRLDLKPGRYLLRIGAHAKELDRSGSVYYDVEVPDFSKPALSLSGIVLTATPGLVAEPRDALATLISVVPTTRREFGAEHEVRALVRVYQGGRKSPAAAAVTTRIVDADGKEVFGRTETLPADSFATARSAEYQIDLPVSGLAPGAHVLTLETRAGKAVARRDVRFQVR